MPFSVLISVYYKENPEFLRESLESLFGQTLKPNEVVMIEDGPLTETLYKVLDEYGSRYKELKRVRIQDNVGLGRALNEGLKYCSYDLVARMDTDDICYPDRFEKQIEFMTLNPEIDISSAWLEEFEEDINNIKSIKKVPSTHAEIEKYIKIRSPLNHPLVIFRKEAVNRVGGYQHFPLFEDWFLWARMMKNGAKFANIQEPLLYFRASPQMFRRRGGLKYAIDSTLFQWKLHELGITSVFGVIKASILRGVVYLLPNSIRRWVYLKLLRY